MVTGKMIFIYPGSFDTITNGHLDIINRAVKLCDKLIVAVGTNISKKPAFSVEERIELIKASIGENDKIEVTSFSGLLVDFAKKHNSHIIIKGLRAVSDFEYEFQMALMNRELAPEVETIFIVTDAQYSYLSSSAVKEVFQFGGSVQGMVPPGVYRRLRERFPPKDLIR